MDHEHHGQPWGSRASRVSWGSHQPGKCASSSDEFLLQEFERKS